MSKSVFFLLCAVAVCALAGVAAAADPSPGNVTITMTSASIIDGDPVTFVFHNGSDYTVYGRAEPAFMIRDLATDEVIFAGMLAVCPPYAPMIDHSMGWDQTMSMGGDALPGNYRVELEWFCDDCAEFIQGCAAAEFEITEPIAAVPATWGEIRSLLR